MPYFKKIPANIKKDDIFNVIPKDEDTHGISLSCTSIARVDKDVIPEASSLIIARVDKDETSDMVVLCSSCSSITKVDKDVILDMVVLFMSSLSIFRVDKDMIPDMDVILLKDTVYIANIEMWCFQTRMRVSVCVKRSSPRNINS